jgi:hypothetical protein
MARRIDIELTSRRDDTTWTWRAAGAKQPKGTVDATLVPPEASVGDVMKAEVEGFLDGLSIVAVVPPKPARSEPERIELLTPRRDGPLVTGPPERRRGERPRRQSRRDGEREGRDGRDGRRREGARGERRERPSTPPPEPKPKARRLRPGRAHRNALLEALPAEQQPIAEQLLQGGIPAVRQAIQKQNEELKAEGKPEVKPEPLLDIAEKLRSRAQTALWRDRAEAALRHVDDLDLRDLRSVVNAADDAGRDEESRTLATQLREALVNRVEKEQAAWVAEVAENLNEGRVVRALRLSSRPPGVGAPVPPALSEQLVIATSEALTAETGTQRWATVLDALAYSPIRRRVVPSSLPEKLSPELREIIARLGDRLPEIAHIFDITPKPGPNPTRPGPRARRRPGAGTKTATRRPAKAAAKAKTGGRADRADKANSNGAVEANGVTAADAIDADEPKVTEPELAAPVDQVDEAAGDTPAADTVEAVEPAATDEVAPAEADTTAPGDDTPPSEG